MTEEKKAHFDLLQELGGIGEFKCGLLGGAGAGKSFTAIEIAIGLKKFWELPGPIAMFDTEKGSAFLRDRVKKETGQDLVGYLGRSRDKLLRWLDQVVKAGVSVAVIDSITHVSDNVRDSFVNQRNRNQNNRKDRRLQIDEIMAVQDAWKPVVDAILNASVHLICCGRLGFEWGHEDIDGSGNLQLVRTDRKMKAMGGFGYELDLICDLERQTKRVAPGKSRKATVLTDESIHLLTVVKDRFDELDGAQVTDPTFDFFKPYIDKLDRGASCQVDTITETDHGLEGSTTNKWRREKQDRAILCEKIKEEMERCWTGSGKAEKAAKADHAEAFFGTRSWTEMSETMDVGDLQSGWIKLYRYCRAKFPVSDAVEKGGDALAMEQPPKIEETMITADAPAPPSAEEEPREPWRHIWVLDDVEGECCSRCDLLRKDYGDHVKRCPGIKPEKLAEEPAVCDWLQVGQSVEFIHPRSKAQMAGRVTKIDMAAKSAMVIPAGLKRPINMKLDPKDLTVLPEE